LINIIIVLNILEYEVDDKRPAKYPGNIVPMLANYYFSEEKII